MLMNKSSASPLLIKHRQTSPKLASIDNAGLVLRQHSQGLWINRFSPAKRQQQCFSKARSKYLVKLPVYEIEKQVLLSGAVG